MPTPIPSEDEPLIESYSAAYDAALPPATPLDRDRARRAEITAHAVATLATIRAMIAASQVAA